MAKIKVMVDGGKATTSPAMAQTLGPMGINLGEVVSAINEKTSSFAGIKVPVEIDVNEKNKTYEIVVGSPPTGELIKKELNLKKGSGSPDKIKSGNISIEQVIKIAKMKRDGMFDNTLKAAVKSVAGSCNSLGVLIESKISEEFTKDVNEGRYDKQIESEAVEVSPEKIEKLKQELVEVQDRLNKEFAKKQKGREEKKKEEKEEEGEEKKEEGEETKTEEKKEEPKKK